MHRLTLVKNHVFRTTALVLLAAMAWAVLIPESNLYSIDKTFIKPHTLAADNFALVLAADDKEDNDEAIDLQFSADFSIELPSLSNVSGVCKIKVSPTAKMIDHQVYISHRQLLI